MDLPDCLTMGPEALPALHCFRCVYTWSPRHVPVRMCPRCKSKLWDRPLVRKFNSGSRLGLEDVLGPHRAAVLAMARRYGARRVRVFGSVRWQQANRRSDLDLLVDDLPGASLLDVAQFEVELGRLLGRPVDVVEEDSLPWSIRPQVLAEAVPL